VRFVISILLADQRQMFCEGLVRLFGEDARFFPVRRASNGDEAMEYIRAFQPDVAILSMALPKQDGLNLASLARSENLATRCVILTLGNTPLEAPRIHGAGAKGFMSMEAGFQELADLVTRVAKGESGQFPVAVAKEPRGLENRKTKFGLSGREEEVLGLVGRGLTSKRIASALFISARTVDTHRSRIMQKLDIGNGPGLVKFAMENGIM
jgi:DNA-binding NarL/FixJ family response regulator